MPTFKRSGSKRGRSPQSPNRNINGFSTAGPTASSAIDDLQRELDDLVIPPTDEEPVFYPRPDNAGDTYLEELGLERADEQKDLFQASGEDASRPHRQRMAGNQEAATNETFLIDAHKPTVSLVWEMYQAQLAVFGSALVRRSPKERRYYHLRMLFLLLGDIVGVTGGAIALGEVPWLAVLQASAAGVAAVTSGLLGSEIKDSRLARKRMRDPESLSDHEEPFAHVFSGPDAGEQIVKMMVLGSLSVVVLLGVGIFMLRSSTEGRPAGIVFGCIAMAVALASWINTFHYTDELADLMEAAEINAKSITAYHQELTGAPARAIVAEAQASVESIVREHEAAGRAAAHRVRAMVLARLVGQVSIVGHGRAASPAGADGVPAERDRVAVEPNQDLATTYDIVATAPSTNGHHADPEPEASV